MGVSECLPCWTGAWHYGRPFDSCRGSQCRLGNQEDNQGSVSTRKLNNRQLVVPGNSNGFPLVVLRHCVCLSVFVWEWAAVCVDVLRVVSIASEYLLFCC